jgi:alkanesulfonate monooxygenase SsuD/methylene tetrahydromethanopterin reductase-like flavin-dependent oxidoreductase (luciferase family)
MPAATTRLSESALPALGGGSDRLIDAVIPRGTPEQIAAAVDEHFAAGADHVCVQPLGHGEPPVDDYRALAAVLITS